MTDPATAQSSRRREIVERIVALILFALLGAVLGHTFLGHSSGPYGVCYGSSGRSIPCSVAQSSHGQVRRP